MSLQGVASHLLLALAILRCFSHGKLLDNKLQKNNSDLQQEELEIKNVNCRLLPTDENLHERVMNTIERQAKLIKYNIAIANRTDNPLLANSKWIYQANLWARVAHSHGITILSLAFNYGVLSLMTLSFGVVSMPVELVEEPAGCLSNMTEMERLEPVMDILKRDFQPDKPPTIIAGGGICHQMIKNYNGHAKFTDECCFKSLETGDVICEVDMPNTWLSLLGTLLAILSLVVLFFGPLLATSWLYSWTLDVVRYVVKLKEPQFKTLCICEGDINPKVWGNHVIDLRERPDYKKCKSTIKDLPTNTVIPIKISDFDITVNYAKLLPETQVPVGVFQSLSRAVFLCRLQDLSPFQDCCEADMLGFAVGSQQMPWINACRVIGRVLLVLTLPIPFYIRLVAYFMFEDPEIQLRQAAAAKVDLPLWFDNQILQYLTPYHPIFITIYIMYFGSGLSLAILSIFPKKSRFQQVLGESMKDLLDMSWIDALAMLTKNFLWPFRKFGIFGLFVGLIYWLIIIPLSIIGFLFYCLPMIYISGRLIYHSLKLSGKQQSRTLDELQLPGQIHNEMQVMETDYLLSRLDSLSSSKKKLRRLLSRVSLPQLTINLSLAVVCIGTLLAIMVMVTECVSFVLQICVFTLMGIIVNAGKVLKYGTLIFLVVIYSYDCYNNVYVKYLKLNKALFKEIRGRIKEVDEVTSLPSHLQENRGFKACENSEQADYENDDDLSKESPCNMIINDLILFVDNNDTPRIPKQLFEDVCEIEVAGSPGPVYRSLIVATGKFFMIIMFLLFVFVVVMSFGDVYKVSSTNQMLATMAGGFMPFLFTSFLKPATPDIELNTVSFKSKLEEVIINFFQAWPMHDFPFDIEEKPEEDEEEDEKGDTGSKKGGVSAHGSKATLLDPSSESGTAEEQDLQARLAAMSSVKPADGQLVDIVVLVPDSSEDWILEWSSVAEYETNHNTVTEAAYDV